MTPSTQTKTIIRPAVSKIVTALRDRVKKDLLFNAIMNRWAQRERARTQVTLQTLRVTMTKEGYNNFPIEAYQEALKFLADIGLGRIEKNASGKVTALKEIRHTLQSIGAVASGKTNAKLETFTPNTVFEDLATPAGVEYIAATRAPAKPKEVQGYNATLTVEIDGKLVKFPLPRIISANELGFLLAELYSGDMKAITGGTQQ